MIDTITNTPAAHAMNAAMHSAILSASPFASGSEWDRRMADYLRAAALQRADEKFGALAMASEQSELRDIRLEGQFGPNYRNIPEARCIMERENPNPHLVDEAHCNDFCKPLWDAQRDLVLTPAPNLAAALFKANLIEQAELDNDNAMTADCFQIVAEDFARLAAAEHPDAAIIAAWDRRQEAYARYNALPGDDQGDMAEAHKAEWSVIDQCELAIREAVARTPQGVRIQLWTSIGHMVFDRADDEAAQRGDLGKISENEERHDWTVRVALAAIPSLEAMDA